jgi:hypothetical protein
MGIDSSSGMTSSYSYLNVSDSSTTVSALIPANFKDSLAYVKLMPYRYGNSPLGMSYGVVKSPISESAFFPKFDTVIPDGQVNALYAERFSRFIEYADSVYSDMCLIPLFTDGSLGFKRNELDSIIARYMVPDTIDSHAGFVVKPCFSKGSIIKTNRSGWMEHARSGVTAVSVRRGVVRYVANVETAGNYLVALFDVLGNLVVESGSFSVHASGEVVGEISTSNLRSEMFFLVVRSDRGETVGVARVFNN